MALGCCSSPRGTASWRGSPQLLGDASISATGIGHLQIFGSPGRAQPHADPSGQGLGSLILLGQGRKIPEHGPDGFVQRKEAAIRICSASTHAAERPITASPDNLPNPRSCPQPWVGWLGAWAHGCSVVPARGRGRDCTAKEFLGQVSGAGSAATRRSLQMAGSCGAGSPDGHAAEARLPGGNAPGRAHPYPRPAKLPATLGTRGINTSQNQGLRAFCSALSQGPALPGIGGDSLCSAEGQDRSQPMSCVWHHGHVSVLTDVAEPAAATGTVCVPHAEGPEPGAHRAPKPPGEREWGQD